MGDRCSVTLTIRKQDLEIVESVFDVAETSDPSGEYAIECLFTEVNYGGQDELEELRAAGVPFHGWHDSGDAYPAAVFASASGEAVHELPAIVGESSTEPAVAMTGPGTFRPGDLELAERYFTELAQVQALFKIGFEGD